MMRRFFYGGGLKNRYLFYQKYRTRKQKIKVFSLSFFFGIIILVIVFRFLNYLTSATVEICYPLTASLNYRITGTGTIEAGNTIALTVPENILIEDVSVQPGEFVSFADTILTFQLEDLQNTIFQLETEITKLNLLSKQEQVNASFIPTLYEQDALLALQKAYHVLSTVKTQQNSQIDYTKEDLKKANQALSIALKDYETAVKKAKNALLKEKQKQLTLAKQKLEDTLFNRGEEVKQAERNLIDAQRQLDRLNHKDVAGKIQRAINIYNRVAATGDFEAIEQARYQLETVLYGPGGHEEHNNLLQESEIALSRAKQDLDSAQKKWETEISRAALQVDLIEDDIRKVENGAYSFDNEVQKELERVKTEQKNVQQITRKLEYLELEKTTALQNAQLDVESAKLYVKQAQTNDTNTVNLDTITKQLAQLKQNSYQIEIQRLEKKLDQLQQLLKNNGKVLSPYQGVIAKLYVEAGRRTLTDSAAVIASENAGYLFETKIDNQLAQYISLGDIASITLKGIEKAIHAQIIGIELSNIGNDAKIIAKLPQVQYLLKSVGTIEIRKRSDVYQTVIPLSSIVKDDSDSYIFTVITKNSIIGPKKVAKKIPVQILDQSNDFAAIKANINHLTPIISNTNQKLKENSNIKISHQKKP